MGTLGSYKPRHGPYYGRKTVTYYYDYDKQLGWLVYEKEEGKDKSVAIPSKIIRELLLHIDDVATEAWEESMGEDL